MSEPAPLPDLPEDETVDSGIIYGEDEFQRAHDERLSDTLNLDTWDQGVDLRALYERLEAEIEPALAQQSRVREAIRERMFPEISQQPGAPPNAGVYQATPQNVIDVHQRILFAGRLEACDGTVVSHDTLVLTVTQIGVCLVSYQGKDLSFSHRLFRRDLRTRIDDPVDEAIEILRRRDARTAPDAPERRDKISDLARRGIMAFAERAVLMDRSDAMWRMGHGNPVPYELLTGSGSMDLLTASLDLLRRLVDHRRFVFVPSALKDRPLLTIGDALRPLEYVIFETAKERMLRVVENGRYREDYKQQARAFCEDVGDDVVVGLYRASPYSPSHAFFAHREHAHEAALIAIADSALQEHRGFPLAIDLADAACRSVFGADTFDDAVRSAYGWAGEPTRYLNERETRR